MRHAIAIVSVALATAACGVGAHTSPADTGGIGEEDARAAKKTGHSAVASSDSSGLTDDENPYAGEKDIAAHELAKAARPKAGDFHVYRYSGTFTKRPVTLTEQVLSVDGEGVAVTDFVMEDGSRTSALRVTRKPSGEIVDIVRRTGEGEAQATTADFERMMKRIQFVPDSNDDVVSSEATTCLVGADEVGCEVTKYRVTVGSKQATLSISRSEKLPGRDLGGEIVSDSGKIIYSAQLVESGNDASGQKGVALLEHRLSPRNVR
jgi:hypothetical protein